MLQKKLENAKEYYAEKLAEGRNDPIAKMLLGYLERDIHTLQRRFDEQEKRRRSVEHSYTSRLKRNVITFMHRLWGDKNKSHNGLSIVSASATLQTKAATK